MRTAVRWMERHQVALYLLAIAGGAALGIAAPSAAQPLAAGINPVLALLLYVTFLGIPFTRVGEALRDWRFLSTALVINFVVVPGIVFGLSRIVAADSALLIGVLLVLLTPCVDYVIVFTGLAGGAKERLLAAAPVLMLVQMLLLPAFLWMMADSAAVRAVDLAPFAEAFLLLIMLPLAAAGLTQVVARSNAGRHVQESIAAAMVPLMMLTLALVVASQIYGVRERIGALLLAIPVFVLFAGVMLIVGVVAGRMSRLDTPSRRAIVFTGVTRNSLVVLPLALALPAALDLAPLVVVCQTLVELVVMVVLVWLVPRIIRDTAR